MKSQSNLQELENEKNSLSGYKALLFLISPVALWISELGGKSASSSKNWLRLSRGFWSQRVSLSLGLPAMLVTSTLLIVMLSRQDWAMSLIGYLAWNISLVPVLRIYLLKVMNRQVLQNIRGEVDPLTAKQLTRARNQFGIEDAEIRYKELTKKGDVPSDFIGTRVIPSHVEIPYFGIPEVSEEELNNVLNREMAIFPLYAKSPDHHLVIGQSGSGKTTLIKRMISAGILSGWRVVLIDLKGDPDDAKSFFDLVEDQSRVRHFPSQAFHFWNGTKTEIAERVISFFPSDSEPYYLSRNSSAIHAVVSRSQLPAPQSVEELVDRIRNGIKYCSNPDDIRFFSTKERGLPIGDLIANDVSMNLDAIRNIENNSPFRFGWGDGWDLSVFTLDGFKPSSLKLADALLNDFASWMFSEERTMSKTPILLVIDEASAFSRIPQVPILTALIQRARSAQVSLVYASQNASAFGADMKNIIHSGAIRWLGVSTEVEDMIGAAGTATVIESGFQFGSNEYTGVISHRNQKEFKIDPDRVKELPTFHWFVSSRGKVSNLFVPPLDF